jgi:hypothetical protein
LSERAGRGYALALAATLALAPLACRHLSGLPPRLRACPGPLRSTHEIAGDFVHLERIRVRGGAVDEAFGLVVQKTGARLVVLGTNAFGAKVFAVTQLGEQLESQSFVGSALAVPPENVLRDLHRAYFLTPEQALASSRSAEPAPSGGIRVASEKCGYEAVIVRVSEQGSAK